MSEEKPDNKPSDRIRRPKSAPPTAMVTLPEQLPMWPEEMRALPNSFARSALFNVAHVRKGARAIYRMKPIASVAGVVIAYTGDELRQDDEDLFMQVLHLARNQPIGEPVRFTAYSMIKELAWGMNSDSYERLRVCFDRLNATSLSVTIDQPGGGKIHYAGSLIRSFTWKDAGTGEALRHWEVRLEHEIVTLFAPNTYTRLDWSLRLSLPPLAKWLHSFYMTHLDPVPYSVATLHQLTGSEIKQLRQFRYKLRLALELLVERGFFSSALIDKEDWVRVIRVGRQALAA